MAYSKAKFTINLLWDVSKRLYDIRVNSLRMTAGVSICVFLAVIKATMKWNPGVTGMDSARSVEAFV
jgi:hypothetical protein